MEDGEVLVGAPAKRQAVTNPKNTLYAVKRLIGRRFEEKEVQKDIELMPYKIVKADNGDAWVEVRGKKIAPQEVSAEILMKMKKTAEDYLGEAGHRSRHHGSRVLQRLAAPGDQGCRPHRGPRSQTHHQRADGGRARVRHRQEEGDRKIAVYDLGGGTFDISIIEIAEVEGEHQFEVLSTNGDTFLGGEDFDQRLMDYLVDEFKKETGLDLRKDMLALQRLKDRGRESEDRALVVAADRSEPALHHDRPSGPKHLAVKITRAKFESLVDELIDARSSRAASRSRMRA